MAPHQPDLSMETRIAILETRIGASDSGIIGEIATIKKQLREMEMRIYIASGGFFVAYWFINNAPLFLRK